MANRLVVLDDAGVQRSLAPGTTGNVPKSDGSGSWTVGAPALVSATRIGVIQFENTINHVGFGQSATVNERKTFIPAIGAKRVRAHISNKNFATNAAGTGTIQRLTCHFGAMAPDASNGDTANFAATPTSFTFAGGTTLSGTGYQVSNWVTVDSTTWKRGKRYVLSIGATTSGTTETFAAAGGRHWVSVVAGFNGTDISAQLAPAGLTLVDNQGYFEVFLEFEYEDDRAASILIVSSSLAWATNSASIANRGEIDTFGQQWARANGGICASIAFAGAWASHFSSGASYWNHYSGLSSPINYDAIVYLALPSSDIAGGSGNTTDINLAKTSFINAVTKGQTDYPNARHITSTLTPRNEFTGSRATVDTTEYARVLMNRWLASCPAGIDQCFDPEGDLSNFADPAKLRDEVDSDGVHLHPNAHQRILASSTIIRNV